MHEHVDWKVEFPKHCKKNALITECLISARTARGETCIYFAYNVISHDIFEMRMANIYSAIVFIVLYACVRAGVRARVCIGFNGRPTNGCRQTYYFRDAIRN